MDELNTRQHDSTQAPSTALSWYAFSIFLGTNFGNFVLHHDTLDAWITNTRHLSQQNLRFIGKERLGVQGHCWHVCPRKLRETRLPDVSLCTQCLSISLWKDNLTEASRCMLFACLQHLLRWIVQFHQRLVAKNSFSVSFVSFLIMLEATCWNPPAP